MNIAFRVSEPAERLVSFYDQIKSSSSDLIIYEHKASQIHIHGLIIDCKVSTDTLKNWIKKALGIKAYDKSKWSFKTEYKDKDNEVHPVDYNFITYMAKGSLIPYLTTVSEDIIEKYKNDWIEPQKFHSTEKDPKITIWNISQEVDQIYRSQYGEYQVYDGIESFSSTIENITPIVIKVLRKYRKGFDVFMVRKIITTAMSSHDVYSRVLTDSLKNMMLR